MPRRGLTDLARNPKNIGYGELLAVLAASGCRVREGTKHRALVQCGSLTMTVPRPHGKRVQPVYVREAVRLLMEMTRDGKG